MIEFYKTLSKFFGIDMFNITYTIRNPKEKELWKSIEEKAKQGLNEFLKECEEKHSYWGWPWVSPELTKEEQDFLNKIHEKYYGKDYYITDPISQKQCDYSWYIDIKDRIIY